MKNNKTKVLLVSMVALCMCVVVIAGGTFALFTGDVTVNNHLVAGNLDVGFKRIEYKENTIGANGLMTVNTDGEDINLKENANAIFDVRNAAPTCSYEAKLEVSNLGSTAFDYEMKVVWKPNKNKEDNDEIFAQQIEITVTYGDSANPQSVSFMLPDCEKPENKIKLGYILAGGNAQTFTVTAEFVDDAVNNNAAMSADIKFDVTLYATQKVSL